MTTNASFNFISDIGVDQELESFDMEGDSDAWRFDVSRCNNKYFHWNRKRFSCTAYHSHSTTALIIDCKDPSTNDTVESLEFEQTRLQERSP